MVQSDGAGIDRKEQPLVAQVLVQLVARHAGLARGSPCRPGLTSMMRVMRDRSSVMPPRTGVTWPFQRGAGAPGHHRHVLGVAEREQPRGLVGCLDERDRVGQDRRLGVLTMRVVLAQRGVGGDAVAQEVAGGRDHGVDWSWHRWSSGVLLAGLRQRGHAGKPWRR